MIITDQVQNSLNCIFYMYILPWENLIFYWNFFSEIIKVSRLALVVVTRNKEFIIAEDSSVNNVLLSSGLGTGLFGNKAQTGFGSTFSQPQSSGTSGGLFGSTTTNTAGGSIFGGTATGSIFGQQPTSQCKCCVIAIIINPFIVHWCKLQILIFNGPFAALQVAVIV